MKGIGLECQNLEILLSFFFLLLTKQGITYPIGNVILPSLIIKKKVKMNYIIHEFDKKKENKKELYNIF